MAPQVYTEHDNIGHQHIIYDQHIVYDKQVRTSQSGWLGLHRINHACTFMLSTCYMFTAGL